MRTTFALQSKLPRLPIPKLEATVHRYLQSVKPFPALTASGTTERVAKAFLEDPKQGPMLQQRLIEYDKKQAVLPIKLIGFQSYTYLEFMARRYLVQKSVSGMARSRYAQR